jgi:hypothetical protein
MDGGTPAFNTTLYDLGKKSLWDYLIPTDKSCAETESGNHKAIWPPSLSESSEKNFDIQSLRTGFSFVNTEFSFSKPSCEQPHSC